MVLISLLVFVTSSAWSRMRGPPGLGEEIHPSMSKFSVVEDSASAYSLEKLNL